MTTARVEKNYFWEINAAQGNPRETFVCMAGERGNVRLDSQNDSFIVPRAHVRRLAAILAEAADIAEGKG